MAIEAQWAATQRRARRSIRGGLGGAGFTRRRLGGPGGLTKLARGPHRPRPLLARAEQHARRPEPTAGQTRKSPIPVPPIPDFAGKRGGNPRFPARPESGKRESPIPDSAGNGNRGPDWPQIGKSGIPLCVSTAAVTVIHACPLFLIRHWGRPGSP